RILRTDIDSFLSGEQDSSVVVSCSPDKNESMSVRKILLFLPEPETSCIFTSCSLAYFLTEGIAITLSPVTFVSLSSSVSSVVLSGVFSCSSLSSSVSGEASGSTSSYPAASILTSTSPTTATVPSSTCIFEATPATGDGISTTEVSL